MTLELAHAQRAEVSTRACAQCGAGSHDVRFFGVPPGPRFRDDPTRPEGTTRQSFGEFVLDGAARQLFRCGRTVHLTPKAFDLLGLLVGNPGRALSKEEIHERLWPGVHVSESNLPVLMHELRDPLRRCSRGSW